MNGQVEGGATPTVDQEDTAVPSTPAEQKKTEDEMQSAPVALSPLDDLAKLRKFKAEVEASRRSAKDAHAPSITAIAESFLKSHLSPAMTSTTFPVARMSVDGVSPKTVVTQEASAAVSREQELKERLLRAKTRSDDTNHLTGDKRPASQSIQDSDSNKKPRARTIKTDLYSSRNI
ncbi:hypothetical protein TREMEDRAFT_71213 [Tremella mesenterica DSM 1558]|uniref:uncharacterized protein n=1 Tax=Tremella mesenterica (strain ATCC 24925 / CBS 8224 / DSM 1558 / NBRC 9311 / NRRL Y-6157 / RJB 2259-6 / UBC 559-6) TaxID=578456 RepID=UPI0003F48F0A|nr:uncharacterized protein TREMEDRAFT_71213 [Tremella mesenterica DSM 1558]EIW71635.1 hypothetical protein TREMEDRAFT_71213 [Tremella mesenterica DSM 1558]